MTQLDHSPFEEPPKDRRFALMLRRIALIALAVVLLLCVIVIACGFRYQKHTQGALTVRIFGIFTEGQTTAKHHYSNGICADWNADAEQWECSDNSIFRGELKDGFFVSGSLITDDFTYSGTFANGNQPNGFGTIAYRDSTAYEGDFVDGRFHGSGTLHYPDGSYFIGSFAQGLRHGLGTLYRADGTVVHSGNYQNDIAI